LAGNYETALTEVGKHLAVHKHHALAVSRGILGGLYADRAATFGLEHRVATIFGTEVASALGEGAKGDVKAYRDMRETYVSDGSVGGFAKDINCLLYIKRMDPHLFAQLYVLDYFPGGALGPLPAAIGGGGGGAVTLETLAAEVALLKAELVRVEVLAAAAKDVASAALSLWLDLSCRSAALHEALLGGGQRVLCPNTPSMLRSYGVACFVRSVSAGLPVALYAPLLHHLGPVVLDGSLVVELDGTCASVLLRGGHPFRLDAYERVVCGAQPAFESLMQPQRGGGIVPLYDRVATEYGLTLGTWHAASSVPGDFGRAMSCRDWVEFSRIEVALGGDSTASVAVQVGDKAPQRLKGVGPA